ncbi:hypothetical protein [Methylobacterium sp. Leaf117]|uniref:hypothetical protein n=1 Tax=Methylobacterium sp. Leaf117 TaxID=1736260 RepID=UPI0006FA062E|nr:hypothetical protein [Methylobacterium sp. Leaf117]KQP82751.1 hypothetical protein ASF57_11380 [Methylobacterium sp. Leaf117]
MNRVLAGLRPERIDRIIDESRVLGRETAQVSKQLRDTVTLASGENGHGPRAEIHLRADQDDVVGA